MRILSGTCGDGYRESSEACDDGNLDAGDGCSESPGFAEEFPSNFSSFWFVQVQTLESLKIAKVETDCTCSNTRRGDCRCSKIFFSSFDQIQGSVKSNQATWQFFDVSIDSGPTRGHLIA